MLFMFPGQGSQKIGMGKKLYENFATARKVFEEADDSLSFKLSKLMFDGNEEELRLTKNAQPAIMTVSMAYVNVLRHEFSINFSKAKYFAGHSLGEYTALCAAGVLSLAQTCRILGARGLAMEKAYPHGGAMAAILGLSIEELEQVVSLSKNVQIANDNSIGQAVISGIKEDVEKAMEMAKERGAKRAILLTVSGPFHSKFMAPAEEALRKSMEGIVFAQPSAPIISNVTAKAETSDFERLLIQQLTNRVRWRESLIYAHENNVNTFVEIGEGNVLSGLVKRTLTDVDIVTVNNIESLESFATQYESK